jgi:hypothetical protein
MTSDETFTRGATTGATAEGDALWSDVSALLDESLAQLGEPTRLAVVLRFFERKSMREVGSRLGISEEAARQRVCRGLEKLRQSLSRRSVVVPVAALAALLSAHAVNAAPPGVAPTLASAASVASAVASTTPAGHGGSGWLLGGWLKGSAAACGALAVAGSVGALVAWEFRGRPAQETVQLAAPTPTTRTLPPGFRPGRIAVGTKDAVQFEFEGGTRSLRIVPGVDRQTQPLLDYHIDLHPSPDAKPPGAARPSDDKNK